MELLSTMFSDQYLEFPFQKVEEMCQWLMVDDQEKYVPSLVTEDFTEDSCGNSEMDSEMEYNEESILYHLFNAYAEATENGYEELKEVIAKSVLQKINPLGDAMERVIFWKFQTPENIACNYLKDKSNQNIEIAFNAFYLSFPYGKFAHFTANAAILESIPRDDVDSLHVVDFDMGDGVQWAPFLESMSKKGISFRFTSMKFEKESNIGITWKFEETKRRLFEHAQTSGGSLVQIEEMELEDLMIELKRVKKGGVRNEWTVFNCMISLPHMVARRPWRRSRAMEFLAVAKTFLADYPRRGIITIGDGEVGAEEWSKTHSSNFVSFFNNRLNYYEVVLESMEKTFPVYLREARISMETHFVAPHICSDSWFQEWKEMKEIQEKFGDGYGLLEDCKFSMENMSEAKGLVNEEDSLFMVRLGQMDNEMVLEWGGYPLVRVSTWI